MGICLSCTELYSICTINLTNEPLSDSKAILHFQDTGVKRKEKGFS